ncbi:hypothetical protein [Nonomuraea jabiensis]|uniref:hypothetical protein n=1 Tax=Nonomuraea jabiensis TaxID=882448 RepID=UPI0036D206B1
MAGHAQDVEVRQSTVPETVEQDADDMTVTLRDTADQARHAANASTRSSEPTAPSRSGR